MTRNFKLDHTAGAIFVTSKSRIKTDAERPFFGTHLAVTPIAFIADSLCLQRTQRFEPARDVACAPSRRRLAVGAALLVHQHRDSHFRAPFPPAAVAATVHKWGYQSAHVQTLALPPRLPNDISGSAR